MNKTTKILLALFFGASIGHAATIAFPTYNQTAQSVFDIGRAPFNFKLDIPSAGPTDRTQAPSNTTTACTAQASSSNAGSVYAGGSNVTNASGLNPGIELVPGASFSSVAVSNSNLLFFAADNAGDDVTFFCN